MQALAAPVHIDVVQHDAKNAFNVQARRVHNEGVRGRAQRGHGPVAVKGVTLAYLFCEAGQFSGFPPFFKVAQSPVFSRGRKFTKLNDVLQVIGI